MEDRINLAKQLMENTLDSPGLPGPVQCHHQSPQKWGREAGETVRAVRAGTHRLSLASKAEEGARSQGMQVPREAGKGKKVASPLEPSEGTQLRQLLKCSSVRPSAKPTRTDSRNGRWCVCVVLSHHVGTNVTEAARNEFTHLKGLWASNRRVCRQHSALWKSSGNVSYFHHPESDSGCGGSPRPVMPPF